MGAAYLAGLTTGVWASTDEIAALPRSVDRFDPQFPTAERERLYDGWQEALARATLRPA
jgi:glycerol kinase